MVTTTPILVQGLFSLVSFTRPYQPRGVRRGESIDHAAPPDEPPKPEARALLFKLPPEGLGLDDLGMSLVEQALEHSNGNQTRAAELLGIARDQLRYRLKKLESASDEVKRQK